MASNMQSFQRMLKMLRENSSIREKREALTYFRSNSKKLRSSGIVKEEQCKELCKLVVETFANGNNDIQNEAYATLSVIIQDFKEHTLNLFEALSQINQKNRLKILKLLEIIGDNAISTVTNDLHAVKFFTDCMSTIQTDIMPWIAPTACVDNIQALIDAENKPLSDDQRLEEETVNYCIILLRRLYKLAAITSDTNTQKFDALLVDKVMLLAYMGHKRQRGGALKLLQQSLATNILSHVRTKLPNIWTHYKLALQTTYCKRMLLLVSACELDWAAQWNISIQFLGVDLHKGAGLINDLLSIEEKAFKSTDTITRRQAFLSWKLLVDNFALDPQELATARRIKLLCIPLNAKNSKTELIAITKLEVWWHVIIKLYKDISKFVNPVLTQFLNFCFGPLGDTPLLSAKCDVIASPGKRFYKTKIIAVDALCQLLVPKQENHSVFSSILEERLPHSMTDAVFQECYKSIIHSVGEALLVLSQLTDSEMKNRYQLGKMLWTSLINYVQESKMGKKENMYKDIILVTTELANYVNNKQMIKQLILDIILFDIAALSKEFNFQEDVLSALVFKLLQISLLDKAEKDHYNALESLLRHCIKSSKENTYYSHAFKCLKETYNKLHTLSNVQCKNESIILKLWLILIEVLITYMDDLQEINEGNDTQHNLKTVESIIMFPFMYMCLEDKDQIKEVTETWKRLCKHFEMRVDLIESIKINEVVMSIASTMEHCLVKNEKSHHLIISCLDILLGSIDYNLLLAHTEVPPIINLILKLIYYLLSNKLVKESESALRAFSAVLVTIYGHNPKKVISYLLNCKPAVEVMLSSKVEGLYKEIACTWESIISIIKGLGILVQGPFLSSYKKIIIQASNHPNFEIKDQTLSIFELKDVISISSRFILEDIENEVNKVKLLTTPKISKKTNDHIEGTLNQVKVADKCLKESSSPKPVPKQIDDYVLIKTDFNFDVSRLTEHQKESLKRKREDIPALYNDLSQSCSQDTQNLQEWFNKRNKSLEDVETIPAKNDNILLENEAGNDANKENQIEIEPEETDKSAVENDTKSAESVRQSVSTESSQQVNGDIDNGENSLIDNETPVKETICENSGAKTSKDCIIKIVSFNAQEESQADKDNDQRLSPSILNTGKRPNRSGVSQKSEVASSQSDEPSTFQKRLRIKSKQTESQNVLDETENKLLKKGVKRKSGSDSESERGNSRQRQKSNLPEAGSDTESCKSTESDTTAMRAEEIIDSGNLSQRTRNEISRLRINMVFDCPASTSRRSKGPEDNKVDKKITRRLFDGRSTRSRSRGRMRRRRLGRSNELNKTDQTEYTKKTLQNKRSTQEKEQKMEEEGNKEKDTSTEVATTSSSTSNSKDNLSDPKESNEIETVVNEELSNNAPQTTDVVMNENSVETTEESSANDQNDKSTEEKSQTQDDMEDIIESSQKILTSEEKCNEKQCIIKISNIEEVLPTGEDEEVTQIVSKIIDISKNNTKETEETNEAKLNEPSISTSVTDTNSCDNEKHDPVETPRVNEGQGLFKYVVEFSSPKGNPKGPLKFKGYSTQGRAAHMLGLVTKQARMEAGCNVITIHDESVLKKAKSKDTDTETPGKKERGFILKEADKITCSSRQEKIFNNMKSADYCSSPPIKLFCNLRNDGEKSFPKPEKSIEYISIQPDTQGEKGEDTSVEMDELPILEWSSANPPSLTASPSVSILKRHRQSLPEPDPECVTPNKRKRVSFADPPVSKEMGYEITSNDFAHKTNKFVSKSVFGRKDTPLRVKQIRQKLIPTDSDKMEKDEETDIISMSEVDLQCEKENELLTKMAEELEYSENVTINTDTQAPYNDLTNNISVEVNGCNKINVDNLSTEFEISQNSTFSKHTESSANKVDKNKVNHEVEVSESPNVSSMKSEFNDSATQEDLFNGTNAKHNDKVTETSDDTNRNDTQNISVQILLSSLDSIKINATKESITNRSFDGHANADSLEDTLDAENFTRLNSSANSDEIFCGNLIRTSTQRTESTEEQDTLPVTDSVFGSLPLSQDSQSPSEFHAKVPQPELLNNVYPIYPTLIVCQEPISSIVQQLTNPLWVRHLTAYFANRNLQTVGDLARLSEREINRMPIKGNSKVEFVKSVLRSFEQTYIVKKETSNIVENLNDVSSNNMSPSVNTPVSISELTQNKLVNQFSQPGSCKVSGSTAIIDKTTPEMSKKVSDSNLDESLNVPAIDVSSIYSQVSYKSVKGGTPSSSVSVSSQNSSNVTTKPMINVPISSMVFPASSSEALGGSNFIITSGATLGCLMKTAETSTGSSSISSTKTEGQKTSRSVAAQMALEDLLDEIDVNLVLESAVRRCTAERILLQYKNKMKHMSQVELEKETIRMLGADNVKNCSEVTLRAACRACGVNKVLLRLPDIFGSDRQFFTKVLNAYKKKIQVSDCLDILDFAEVKDAICKKCTSSELAEILSKKLKEEEQEGIREPMTELSSLNAMLKRMPMDLIISHTVANEELIPSRVVLDIALQNNSTSDIAQALECQSSLVTKDVFEKLWSSQFAVNYIEQLNSKQDLLKLFKAISLKLSQQDLLQAFYESMSAKVMINQEKI
ncbi:telomere-associated protein RIF1-like isoform X1 [Osmia bicornis bicornis]|uniref:telomere-associated protein RIF1-like isoform X1 n=1 Tax=Osmia bicornis bicornis TaxID=1437191 RepID=UPI001EAF5BBD|nr:telomere-associated protein RIF1-like isoform X1 [Osmia bicornis bicornis]